MLSSIRYELARLPAFSIPVDGTQPGSSASGASPGSAGKKRSALSKLSSTGNLLAGAVARTSVGFVLNPITILKARYESSAYAQYTSFGGALRSLFASGGVRGLFQGFTATAVRDAPYAGIYVVFYEKCKELAG